MEIGLESDIPNYAGGLGILAGDILNSLADLKENAIGISLMYKEGFYSQEIYCDGSQSFYPSTWEKEKYMVKIDAIAHVQIDGRTVAVACWKYEIISKAGHIIPVYLLDTDIPGNHPTDRAITKKLYAGGHYERLSQEIVLGIGGIRILRELGIKDAIYHMNEGHCAFLTLELLRENEFNENIVKNKCFFSTHTPIPAGHDIFSYELAWQVVGDMLTWNIKDLAGQESLSMTRLALNMSKRRNGVSQKHTKVSQAMFPDYKIENITNGINIRRWASKSNAKLFKKYLKGWELNPEKFSDAIKIPSKEIAAAQAKDKKILIEKVNRSILNHCIGNMPKELIEKRLFSPKILTITFARRTVPYKRPDLIYQNIERLLELGEGKIQIIHAGKAHPGDIYGQDISKKNHKNSK